MSSSQLLVPIEPAFLPTVQAYIQASAERYEMDTAASCEFAQAGTELVELLLRSAFEPGDDSLIEISCVPGQAGVELIVHDRGLPLDERQWSGETAAPALLSIRSQVDEVQYLNLGVDGKETRLIKYFERLNVEKSALPPVCDAVDERPVEYRLLQPGDGIHVSRCVYHCYGYSYGAVEAVYFPDRLEALNASGQIISILAVAPDGCVAAHMCLDRGKPDSSVATAGIAAVLPSFRSRGLAGKMGKMLLKEGFKRGIRQIQSYAVTSHPYSQKLFAENGFKVLSLWLGTAFINFKGIKDEPDQRESMVGAVLNLAPSTGPPEVLYAPTRHRAMIETLCAHIECNVVFQVPESEKLPEVESSLQVTTSPFRNLAKLVVEEYGSDIVDQVRMHVNQLRHQNFNQLSLTLPLGNPATYFLTKKFEKLGMFFCGLLIRDVGICLVLQYLHGVAIDYDKIIVESDMARELLAYVRCQDPQAL